jgi:hypothetical protein
VIKSLYMLKHAEEYNYWCALDAKYREIIFEKVAAAKAPLGLGQRVVNYIGGGFSDLGSRIVHGKKKFQNLQQQAAVQRFGSGAKKTPKQRGEIKAQRDEWKQQNTNRMYGTAALGVGTLGAVGGAGYLLGKD